MAPRPGTNLGVLAHRTQGPPLRPHRAGGEVPTLRRPGLPGRAVRRLGHLAGLLLGSIRLRPGEFGDPWLIDRHEGLSPQEARAQARARWQFRVRYRDHSGRVRELAAAGATKRAARRALERRIDAKRHDLHASGVLHADSTLATLADEWLAEREHLGGLAVNTLAVYKSEVRRLVKPVFGRLRLTEASPARLHALLAQVEQTRSSRQTRTVLRQMLDYAISVGALNANPMPERPRPNSGEATAARRAPSPAASWTR